MQFSRLSQYCSICLSFICDISFDMGVNEEMKSKPYKFGKRLFRYDFDECVVEYIYKASAEDIQEEKDWIAEHGRPLYHIDEQGYMVADEVGLRAENWKKKSVRDEYLAQYCDELDEEAAWLRYEFGKEFEFCPRLP